MRIAAGAVMFSEFYIGLLMLVTSILASEIGKQLEAGDRRVNMATSAQSLFHGSIDTMERSLDQQFGELRDAVLTNIRESFAPSLAENAVLRDQVQEMRMESEQGSEAALKQTERVRQHLDAARELIAGLESAPPAPGPVSIQAAVSQQPRSNNVEMNV